MPLGNLLIGCDIEKQRVKANQLTSLGKLELSCERWEATREGR